MAYIVTYVGRTHSKYTNLFKGTNSSTARDEMSEDTASSDIHLCKPYTGRKESTRCLCCRGSKQKQWG